MGKTLPQAMTVADAPGASSSNKCFFIPRYRDVIVPDKHNFATVVEFEHPLTQWIYDVMAGVKRIGRVWTKTDRVFVWIGVALLGIVPALMGNIIPLAFIVAFAVFTVLVGGPIGSRAERSGAKTFKDMTADDWHKVYQDMKESDNRANEIATAIRRSGVVRPRW